MHKLALRKLISKIKIFLLFSFLFLANQSFAQEEQKKTFLQKLTPEQVGLQYAGSIGFVSAAVGYNFFKEKTTLSFHIGYVPESLGGELTILAIKYEYKPWAIKVRDKFIIHPFNPVVFTSYTLGENFDFKFEKPQYRKGYYFWSSALRIHAGFASEVKILTNKEKNSKIKSISVYAETNTNDLYTISWFQNRTSTPIYKIFKLGYGVRMNF